VSINNSNRKQTPQFNNQQNNKSQPKNELENKKKSRKPINKQKLSMSKPPLSIVFASNTISYYSQMY